MRPHVVSTHPQHWHACQSVPCPSTRHLQNADALTHASSYDIYERHICHERNPQRHKFGAQPIKANILPPPINAQVDLNAPNADTLAFAIMNHVRSSSRWRSHTRSPMSSRYAALRNKVLHAWLMVRSKGYQSLHARFLGPTALLPSRAQQPLPQPSFSTWASPLPGCCAGYPSVAGAHHCCGTVVSFLKLLFPHNTGTPYTCIPLEFRI